MPRVGALLVAFALCSGTVPIATGTIAWGAEPPWSPRPVWTTNGQFNMFDGYWNKRCWSANGVAVNGSTVTVTARHTHEPVTDTCRQFVGARALETIPVEIGQTATIAASLKVVAGTHGGVTAYTRSATYGELDVCEVAAIYEPGDCHWAMWVHRTTGTAQHPVGARCGLGGFVHVGNLATTRSYSFSWGSKVVRLVVNGHAISVSKRTIERACGAGSWPDATTNSWFIQVEQGVAAQYSPRPRPANYPVSSTATITIADTPS